MAVTRGTTAAVRRPNSGTEFLDLSDSHKSGRGVSSASKYTSPNSKLVARSPKLAMSESGR